MEVKIRERLSLHCPVTAKDWSCFRQRTFIAIEGHVSQPSVSLVENQISLNCVFIVSFNILDILQFVTFRRSFC